MAHHPPLPTWAKRTTFPSLRPANGPQDREKCQRRPSRGGETCLRAGRQRRSSRRPAGVPLAGATRGPSGSSESLTRHVGLRPCLRGRVSPPLPVPRNQGRSPACVRRELPPRSWKGRSPLPTRRAASAAALRSPHRKPGTAGYLLLLPRLFSSSKPSIVTWWQAGSPRSGAGFPRAAPPAGDGRAGGGGPATLTRLSPWLEKGISPSLPTR